MPMRRLRFFLSLGDVTSSGTSVPWNGTLEEGSGFFTQCSVRRWDFLGSIALAMPPKLDPGVATPLRDRLAGMMVTARLVKMLLAPTKSLLQAVA